MNTQTQTPNQQVYTTCFENLFSFVDQRPGFDLANYGSYKDYRKDYSECLKDKNSFYELLSWAASLIDVADLQKRVYEYLKNNSGRLFCDDAGKITYHVGQYFPTEYRNAACRVVSNVLWQIVRDQNPDFTGHDIRKFIYKRLSTKNSKLFFA